MSLSPSFVKNYEIKISKSGHKVPVVNDVHLHSIYDPIKEAETFIQKTVKENDQQNFLVFGLGFGYHIEALRKALIERKKTPHIVIIEPNAKVAYDCIELGLINQDDCYLSINQSADEVYNNKDLTRFLLKKPQVITHSSSFNLYSDYFKTLLGYESPTSLEHMARQIHSPTLKEYINDLSLTNTSFSDAITSLSASRSLNAELDFLMLALNELTLKSDQLTNG